MILPKFTIIFLSIIICWASESYTQPNIYVDPAHQIVYGEKTVTVNFRISEAINIRTYGVTFAFDSSKLKFNSSIKGPFLSNNNAYNTLYLTTPYPQYITDSIVVAESVLGPVNSASGSGLLFSIKFDIKALGTSNIKIKSVTLYNIDNNLINSISISGYVTIIGKVLVVNDETTFSEKSHEDITVSEAANQTLGVSANLISSSLTTAGYFVTQTNFSSLNISTLSSYDLIILSAGVKESDIFNDGNKRTALVNFALSGGKTLVEGGNVGYLYRKDESSDIDSSFRRYLLLDSSWVNDRIGSNLQINTAAHPIFTSPNVISSPIIVNNGGITGSGARDEMTLLSSPGISRIANWSGGTVENAGIIINNTNGDTSKCKNIFFTFSLSSLFDQTTASKLVVNTAKYLLRDVEAQFKILNLRTLIEGFYVNNKAIPDTLTVELRDTSPPNILLMSKKVLCDTFGLAGLNFTGISNNTQFYLVVKHRNSIETWSSTAKSFASASLTYDFTTDSAKAYGNNLKKVGTKWCIFSGDVNQDGFVNSTDLTLITNNAFNYSAGFRAADLNWDNFIDLNDLIICDDNKYNSVKVIRP